MGNRFFRGLGTGDWGLRRAMFFAVLAVFAFPVRPVAAQQSDRARTEALARRAAARLQSLQREADRLASDERTLMGDLRKLEIERQLKTAELKQIDADAAKIQDELA